MKRRHASQPAVPPLAWGARQELDDENHKTTHSSLPLLSALSMHGKARPPDGNTVVIKRMLRTASTVPTTPGGNSVETASLHMMGLSLEDSRPDGQLRHNVPPPAAGKKANPALEPRRARLQESGKAKLNPWAPLSTP